jgi:arabinofuranan 3-O-arabinosyltransferase
VSTLPDRTGNRRTTLLLALVSYLPLLWSSVGKVAADTKSYLYLEPSRLLARAPYLWDEHIGLGTVTHQNLGYVFPMGPYYWLMDRIGMPDWIAQRIWLGTLLFAAGTGVAYLCRTFRWKSQGAIVVAALAYTLSPYIFDYASRLSVILMPWAGLGWMVAFTVRSLRDGGWKWPARFAVVVALVGGVNATSLLLAGIAPVLYVVHAVVTRQTRVRQAIGACWRIGACSLPVSLWWIAGLRIQGTYGVPILRYTETYEAVARTAASSEVLRGLGYWFFYGQDKVAPWVSAGRPFTQQVWLVLTSFGLVGLALLSFTMVRWRERSYAVLLLVVGVAVAVGAHPYATPSVYGSGFKVFVLSAAGLAMRSTPRAVPLIALASALALGAGAAALGNRLAQRWARARSFVPLAAGALVLANVPTFLLGQIYTPSLLRSSDVPSYWTDATKAIDAGSHDTRVFETPGSDFADYRWGGTIDPITPGLLDKPYVARELIPYGGPGTSDLLNAYERRVSDNVFEPATLPAFAQLISADAIAVRADLQYERYRTARPTFLTNDLSGLVGAGLGTPATFGPVVPNTPIARLPLIDEYALTAPPNLPTPAPVSVYPVSDVAPIVHAAPASSVVVVDGDGESLMDLAAAGVLPPSATVLYGGDLIARPDLLDRSLASGAQVVVTDGNRRQARRWGSVRENLGYTEQVGEKPLRTDINDNRLDLFPGATDDAFTVTELTGAARVQATGYGNPITYTPEDRATQAFDGDPLTAWRVGAFADVTGERVEIQLDKPTTTDHITLLQPINGVRNRWLTSVRLRFDGASPIDADLFEESRTEPGQVVTFPSRTFTTLSIEVRQTNIGRQPGYRGIAAVGFAEVKIDDVEVHETVRLPRTLLGRDPQAPLSIVMSRQRASQLEPNRSDPELSMSRTFDLPSARTFTVSGQARLSGVVDDRTLESILDPTIFRNGTTVTSSARLMGDPRMRASAALDGDPTTAWLTPIDKPLQTLDVRVQEPVMIDHLDVQVINDGRHSLPSSLHLTADAGRWVDATVPLPPAAEAGSVSANAVSIVRVVLPEPLSVVGVLEVGIASITAVRSNDYFSELPIDLPVGIAEVGVPGIPPIVLRSVIDTGCTDGLLAIDGAPISTRLRASSADFTARQAATLEPCRSSGFVLGEGRHVITTFAGRDGGIDVDRLVLSSTSQAAPTTSAPVVREVSHGKVSSTSTVTDAGSAPFWFVFGQTQNAGWQIEADGATVVGNAMANGFANAWLLQPTTPGQPITVRLSWTPQRSIWIALFLSGAALLAVLFVGWRPRRRFHTIVGADDDIPVVSLGGANGSWLPVVLGSVAALVFVAPISRAPLAAGLVAVIGFAAQRWPRSRRVLVWLPAALVGIIAAYIVAKSAKYNLPTDLDWPRAFGATHTLGWLAVCLTAALQPATRRTREHRPPSPTS